MILMFHAMLHALYSELFWGNVLKLLLSAGLLVHVSTPMFHAHSNRSKYFHILSQHTTQAQHIDWSIWIVIIKTLHISWVNNTQALTMFVYLKRTSRSSHPHKWTGNSKLHGIVTMSFISFTRIHKSTWDQLNISLLYHANNEVPRCYVTMLLALIQRAKNKVNIHESILIMHSNAWTCGQQLIQLVQHKS